MGRDMKTTVIILALLLCVLFTLSGCGSVENKSPASIVSKSVLSGTVSPLVMGVQITLILPDGVTVQTDPVSGKPLVTALAPNDVVATSGSLIAVYTPAAGTNPGQVQITIIRGTGTFTAGDFFSVACEVAAGQAVPDSTAFGSRGVKIWDATGNDITSNSGVSATVTL